MYSILLTLALYVTNYQIKFYLLSQLYENKQMKSCISIWIQILVLSFHLLITFLIKHFNKYESDPAVFVFSNGINIVLILLNLCNLYFEWAKDAFFWDFSYTIFKFGYVWVGINVHIKFIQYCKRSALLCWQLFIGYWIKICISNIFIYCFILNLNEQCFNIYFHFFFT